MHVSRDALLIVVLGLYENLKLKIELGRNSAQVQLCMYVKPRLSVLILDWLIT